MLCTVYKNPSFIIGYKAKIEEELECVEYYSEEMKKKFNEILLRMKNNPRMMEQLDTNDDGKISNEEWDKAVRDLKQNLVESQLKQIENMQETDLVVGKGVEDNIFIISSESEKELCKYYAKQLYCEIIALLLGIFSILILQFKFGYKFLL